MNPADPSIPHIMLKLVSGESIICTVVSDSDENMIVSNPMQIHLRSDMTPTGVQTVVYYTRWFFATESTAYLIRKSHIISAALPDTDMTVDYLAMLEKKKTSKQEESSPASDWPDDLNFKIDPNTRFDS